jgi:hypothetical protein
VWKVILDSVEGTSHKREILGCQDACACAQINSPMGPALCIVCSDGAGSAKYAATASQYSCQYMLNKLTDYFSDGHSISELSKETALGWLTTLRTYLTETAQSMDSPADDYACTLLVAVIAWNGSIFMQIGDGAIIRLEGSEYKPVFWPETGEYVNTTFFVTSPTLEERLNYFSCLEPIDELALFTDGLQMLSLDFVKRQAHQPFFTPLFQRLRGDDTADTLNPLLSDFLKSDKVNARTDDDKTLILAVRSAGSV